MIAAEALRLSLRQQQSAESKSAICRRAFDLGITHFDFANNNEPPPGACYSVKTQAFQLMKRAGSAWCGERLERPAWSPTPMLAMTAICAKQTV
jgi:hypothetical protein